MKKKIKLLGIGNQDKYNFYIFEKKKGLLELLRDLFNVLNLNFYLYDEEYDVDDKPTSRKKDINKLKDYHEVVRDKVSKSDGSRVDLFYGDKKVFVVVHCSLELRKKFNDKLDKLTVMAKPKAISSLEKKK